MTATATKIPALRFPEFTGEWAREEFGNIAKRSKAKHDPAKDTVSYPCIELESLSQETGILLDIFDSRTQKSIKNKFKKGDVLFGKLRPYLKKFLVAPFDGVCSSEIWVLVGSAVNNDFLYRLIQTTKFIYIANITSGSKMPRADWDYVLGSLFSYPSRAEQQKIATFLTTIDTRIQQLSRKKALLEQYKKGVMQQLFSQEIRFKDEGGKEFPAWEEKRLGALTYKVGIKNKHATNLPIYSINNKEGFLPQSDQFEGIDSHERGYDISLYKVVNANTFAYNPARINVGSIGYSGNLNEVIISSLYVCFKTKDSLDDQFLLSYLNTFEFNKSVLRNSEGGVRSYLFYENFSNIKIPLPSLKEQQKIAAFLSTLDRQINLVSQQLERMQTFKKGLLQQMFV